jgi:hypothetical protein
MRQSGMAFNWCLKSHWEMNLRCGTEWKNELKEYKKDLGLDRKGCSRDIIKSSWKNKLKGQETTSRFCD